MHGKRVTRLSCRQHACVLAFCACRLPWPCLGLEILSQQQSGTWSQAPPSFSNQTSCAHGADDIDALQKLEVLDIGRNKLTALPSSLCGVTTLVKLIADRNSLKQLPAEVFQWEQMKVRIRPFIALNGMAGP